MAIVNNVVDAQQIRACFKIEEILTFSEYSAKDHILLDTLVLSPQIDNKRRFFLQVIQRQLTVQLIKCRKYCDRQRRAVSSSKVTLLEQSALNFFVYNQRDSILVNSVDIMVIQQNCVSRYKEAT
jgi:hypothetical protein